MAIIGIDLGTTNSACAVWRDAGIQMIPNRLGEYLTPSVVSLGDDGSISVGRVAKDRLISHSDSTVAVFKRLMGTDHRIRLAKREFKAVELSSLILRALKEDAEVFLGEPVTEAVISVPAYFNDNQRYATKLAGELAGIKVERLINEPTAAAMAYGLHERQEGTFLILDMGGGTFDVSILEFFDGVMEVHASAGDNFLGGEDFVEAMADAVLEEAGVARKDLSSVQLNQLLMQMETAKRRIGKQQAPVALQLGERDLTWAVSEEWFIRVVTPLLLRAKRPIERAISDAQIPPQSIDDVILVGGATRLSVFRSMVGRMFGRLPSCHLDPDTAIAMGAAIQAGLKAKAAALGDIVLTDVCPYTLGTEVNGPDSTVGGYFLPIIERNSVVPISVMRTVETSIDNQTEVAIKVFQGENLKVEKNIYLGQLKVKVPRGPAGQEKIDIRYSYDMNGLLEVDITVLSTGKTHTMVIEQAPGALTPEEKTRSHQRLAALKFHPREQESNRAILSKAERLYETSLGEKRERIAHIIAQFEDILNRQNPLEIKRASEKVEEELVGLDTEEWF
jgi:molecular chaperone HscC